MLQNQNKVRHVLVVIYLKFTSVYGSYSTNYYIQSLRRICMKGPLDIQDVAQPYTAIGFKYRGEIVLLLKSLNCLHFLHLNH